MDREKAIQHQATLRGLRDTIGTMQQAGSPPPLGDVVELVEALSGVVNDIVDDVIERTAHAGAVQDLIRDKQPGDGRQAERAIDEDNPAIGTPGAKQEKPGSWPEVERGGRRVPNVPEDPRD